MVTPAKIRNKHFEFRQNFFIGTGHKAKWRGHGFQPFNAIFGKGIIYITPLSLFFIRGKLFA
jgi:hypothetical protein